MTSKYGQTSWLSMSRKCWVRPGEVIPLSIVQPVVQLSGILGIIRKTIKNWLDSTPAFTATYSGSYLVVRDAIYGSELAIIEFKEDHLIINVPQTEGISEDAPWLLGITETGQKIFYSDPKLHTRVKSVVNQAYQQQDC